MKRRRPNKKLRYTKKRKEARETLEIDMSGLVPIDQIRLTSSVTIPELGYFGKEGTSLFFQVTDATAAAKTMKTHLDRQGFFCIVRTGTGMTKLIIKQRI